MVGVRASVYAVESLFLRLRAAEHREHPTHQAGETEYELRQMYSATHHSLGGATILESIMLRTVIITGTIAIAILAVISLLTVMAGPSQDMEYLKFGLTLLLFLVIIIGSYWFVVRGPGKRM
jgi:hypothetical protein